MTMCKILNCDHCKIIQSMKDIINENTTQKKKFKLYEQFYTRSVALTNNTSSEFHRCGYEQAPATASNFCKMHSESFDHWNKKMANTRYQMLNKKDKSNSHYPTFNPMKVETYRKQPPVNTVPFQMNPYLQVPPPHTNHQMLIKHYPPPQTALIASPISLYPPEIPNMFMSRNFSPNHQHLPDSHSRPNSNSIISYPRPSSSQFPNPTSPNCNIKRFPDDIKMNEANCLKKSPPSDELHNFSKNFENSYDWRNCIVEEGRFI